MALITGWGRQTWGEGPWGEAAPVVLTGFAGTSALGTVAVIGESNLTLDGQSATAAVKWCRRKCSSRSSSTVFRQSIRYCFSTNSSRSKRNSYGSRSHICAWNSCCRCRSKCKRRWFRANLSAWNCCNYCQS